jgi:hypothetical protein
MEQSNKSHLLTTLCFFSLGLWLAFPTLVILWLATEDILAGTLLSTTVVVVSFSVSDVASKVLSPLVVSRIAFYLSIILTAMIFVGSIFLIVFVDNVNFRIVGVSLVGFANGLAVITCMRMLAYYDKAGLLASAYVNGTNASKVIASIGYTGKYVINSS